MPSVVSGEVEVAVSQRRLKVNQAPMLTRLMGLFRHSVQPRGLFWEFFRPGFSFHFLR